ncbi:MAG: MurR/RpiR family transcriptional regulator [Clostridiales bacterium]|nr:MurR/RpiR family transcriptional regulator [Clostridiales bacterium]
MPECQRNKVSEEQIEYISRITAEYDSLSKSQKRIANYILTHREEVIGYSITQLARKTNTVPSTITRFCQALSYKGYGELKLYMEKNIVTPLAKETLIQKDDPAQLVLQKLVNTGQNAFADTLRTLDARLITAAAKAILEAGHVVFFGQSSGYASCLYAQQQLGRFHILSQAVTGKTNMIFAAGALEKNDVAVGIAYSGEISSVIDVLRIARENQATVIVITAAPNSTMAKLADIRLLYSNHIPDDLQYLHLASICEITIIGAISAEIIKDPGQKKKIDHSRKALLASRKK